MYFSKFPLLKYPVKDGDNLRYVFVRNLLRRVALSESIKSGESVFMEYSIKDGERPEHIAERVYGDHTMHWLVLLVNEIIDPYHGWYKSGLVFEEYIQKKYQGYAVHITKTDDTFFYNSSVISGCTLTQGNQVSQIIDYYPELCKLVVSGSNFSKGGTPNIGISGGTTLGVKIQRVDSLFTSVHHFSMDRPTSDKAINETVILDPLSQQNSSYSVVGGVIGAKENEYPTVNTQGIGYSGSGTTELWETYIGKYMGISGSVVGTFATSNYVWDSAQNDSKRTIKILHPRFASTAVKELELLLRV
jgi:hypothetical protein